MYSGDNLDYERWHTQNFAVDQLAVLFYVWDAPGSGLAQRSATLTEVFVVLVSPLRQIPG
jgi:hypothetical protein